MGLFGRYVKPQQGLWAGCEMWQQDASFLVLCPPHSRLSKLPTNPSNLISRLQYGYPQNAHFSLLGNLAFPSVFSLWSQKELYQNLIANFVLIRKSTSCNWLLLLYIICTSTNHTIITLTSTILGIINTLISSH